MFFNIRNEGTHVFHIHIDALGVLRQGLLVRALLSHCAFLGLLLSRSARGGSEQVVEGRVVVEDSLGHGFIENTAVPASADFEFALFELIEFFVVLLKLLLFVEDLGLQRRSGLLLLFVVVLLHSILMQLFEIIEFSRSLLLYGEGVVEFLNVASFELLHNSEDLDPGLALTAVVPLLLVSSEFEAQVLLLEVQDHGNQFDGAEVHFLGRLLLALFVYKVAGPGE